MGNGDSPNCQALLNPIMIKQPDDEHEEDINSGHGANE
jgi:hypothetical protein